MYGPLKWILVSIPHSALLHIRVNSENTRTWLQHIGSVTSLSHSSSHPCCAEIYAYTFTASYTSNSSSDTLNNSQTFSPILGHKSMDQWTWKGTPCGRQHCANQSLERVGTDWNILIDWILNSILKLHAVLPGVNMFFAWFLTFVLHCCRLSNVQP